ncbi:MAG: translational GTPase TypA [Myxococcota bacterium]
MKNIRNIAIVAHVDHGKTTLIDEMLKQSGTIAAHRELAERAMDTNALEKERGITILSKCTGIEYQDTSINIVDTPGHADFGGEVERVLKLVDTVLLLVDAFEGPMPQTKFVLKKSLEMGHEPIVVINKIDRPNARPEVVLDEVFELFLDLEANDKQLDFPVIYASGLKGFAVDDPEDDHDDLTPLFDAVIEHAPAPRGDSDAPLQVQIATLNYDDYLGRVAIGRVFRGKVKVGDQVVIARRDGSRSRARITKLFGFLGLDKVETEEVVAGDICAIAGMEEILPGETICDPDHVEPLDMIEIDEPTLSMIFMVNNSPFSGLSGDYLTSRQIRDRLDRELEHNVALKVEDTDRPEAFKVSGRGELHLSVLLEQMRREGYELQISQPEVIVRQIDGEKMEPIEEVVIEVDSDYSGTVINKLQERKGELMHMAQNNDGSQRLEFLVPARGLIGYRSQFLTDTRGTGVMYTNFHDYGPYRGDIEHSRNGALVAMEEGETTTYSLYNLQERGELFVGPGERVYGGQVIGENSRDAELVVNPCKTKKLTNVRASGSDDALVLTPPRRLSLEKAIEFIEPDELVEITPDAIRVRKQQLHHGLRKAGK